MIDTYNLGIKFSDFDYPNRQNQYIKIIELLKNLSGGKIVGIDDFHPNHVYYLRPNENDERLEEDYIIGVDERVAQTIGLNIKSYDDMQKYLNIHVNDVVSHKSSNFFGRVTNMYWNGSIIVYIVENNGMRIKLSVEEIEVVKSKNLSIVFER